MNNETLLSILSEKRIQIGIVDGKLKILDPEQNLDEELRQHLRNNKAQLIELLGQKTELTVADFPFAEMDSEELKRALRGRADIQNIYVATPMQTGMFFHGLQDRGTSYMIQQFCDLVGMLDREAFRAAWCNAVTKYDAFRTSFYMDDRARVHQLVHKRAELQISYLDWSSSAPDVMSQQLIALRESDRRSGFDFSTAPMMRITLVRTAAETHHFVWTLHHSICDGWSQPLIFSDVLGHYAYLTGKAASRFERPLVPYVNYIAWLVQQDREKAVAYWKEYLLGITNKTELQIDSMPIRSGIHGPASLSRELHPDLVSRLRALSRNMSRSLNTIIQAAWGLLLHRYSGDTEVVFGTTFAGRPTSVEGVEQIVGMFLATVPVRMSFSDRTTVEVALSQVHDAFFNAHEHSHIGLGEIQRAANLAAGERLFDSLLVYQNYPDAGLGRVISNDIGISVQNSGGSEQTNYSLLINVFDAEGLTLKVSYRRERFAELTIERLLSHLEQILNGFVCGEGARVLQDLPVLSVRERDLLTRSWFERRSDYGVDCRLNTLLEQQALATPQNIAVICGNRKLSYRELNEQSNRLSHYLVERGVQKNTPVGICMERSIEMMVALFAVMKSGGAYVPMDPKFPASRLEFLANDSSMCLVLTQSSLAGGLACIGRELVCLDDTHLGQVLSSFPSVNVNANSQKLTPDDLIYILYTSGSTGMPKGVLVEHQSVCNFLRYSVETFMPAHLEGSLVSSPLVFDGTVCTLFTPFLCGKYVELMNAEDTDIELLGDYFFDDEEALLIKVTPAHLQALSYHCADTNAAVRHVVVVAGEKLAHQIHWAFERLPNVIFFNEYGPTECSVGSTVYPIANLDPQIKRASVPIGAPLANFRLFVLDSKLRLQPIGVPGELYIGGKGVARGYLNREELTREKFVHAAVVTNKSERLYKTGDVVRWLECGNLEFIDRIDFQVKLRGLRIELGEIEYQLAQCENVKSSVVICARAGESRLVAYVVLKQHENNDRRGELAVQSIKAKLAESLPAYMIPSDYCVLDELPLSNNGKVDRKRLSQIRIEQCETESVAPQTPLEEQLCEIYREILNVPSLGVTHDFFLSGGHSLLAMRTLSQIKRQLGYAVPVKAFFDNPSVRALANYLSVQQLHDKLATLDGSLVEEGSF